MNNNSTFAKKTALASAIVAAMGIGALPQSAMSTVYEFSFAGGDGNVFTMIGSAGLFTNNSDNTGNIYAGNRTPINGSITYDTVSSTGTMVINEFSFFGSGVAIATTITFQAIGDGAGGSGNLMLGNMGFNWNSNNGIPVSIVWDATGFLSAVNSGSLAPLDIVSTGGVLPASNNTDTTSEVGGGVPSATTYPIGPAVIATHTWNTTNIGAVALGTNPSGTLPLVTDTVVDVTNGDVGIGGSPMQAGPFPAFNANFDFTNLLVTCVDSICGQRIVTDTTPPSSAPSTSPITITFSGDMQADTVAAAISLVDVTNSTPITTFTVTPNTGLASSFTINLTTDLNPDPDVPGVIDLLYDTTYQASVATTARDENGNFLAADPDNTWTWTTGSKPPIQVCQSGDVDPIAPLGSNFSMLDAAGRVFGGTNDIAYDFGNGPNNGHNPAILNTSVNGTLGIATNTMASALPHPFFGAVWTAHHIRLFSPTNSPYTINTECTTTELETGACAPNADPSKNITMTVGAGQIGAHILFDWKTSLNIDVVNVWSQNAAWEDLVAGDKNNLWTGARWEGPSGYTVNPPTIWAYVSTDSDSDGENGVKMIDGPFQKFSANFNLGPADSCVASTATGIAIDSSDKVSGGCSLGTGNTRLTERGDWWLIAGFLAWLGLIRKRLARQQP